MGEYGREQRNQLSRAIANSEAGSRLLKKNAHCNAIGFIDKRTRAGARSLMGNSSMQCAKIAQLKWTAVDEEQAQVKLPKDNETITVPINNVLNQQLWAGFDNGGKAVKWGPKKFDILQSIEAKKVVSIARGLLSKEKDFSPPPVAFSTETAKEGNPRTGELILLDSHHTTNALRSIIEGDSDISVVHIARPDIRGNNNWAEVAASREAITRNKNIAAEYNKSADALQIMSDVRTAIDQMKTAITTDTTE